MSYIWADMIRRKDQFHPWDRWNEIGCWGLFYKSEIKKELEKGLLIPYMGLPFDRCLGWFTPSKEAYEKYIKPYLKKGKI